MRQTRDLRFNGGQLGSADVSPGIKPHTAGPPSHEAPMDDDLTAWRIRGDDLQHEHLGPGWDTRAHELTHGNL